MKITLEPTENTRTENGMILYPHATVSISHPDDDANIEETMELIKQALLAWGFSPKTVEDYWK